MENLTELINKRKDLINRLSTAKEIEYSNLLRTLQQLDFQIEQLLVDG